MSKAVKRSTAQIRNAPRNPTATNGRRWLAELTDAKALELRKLKAQQANRRDSDGRVQAHADAIDEMFDHWIAYAERMIELGLPDDYDSDRDHTYRPRVFRSGLPAPFSIETTVCACDTCLYLSDSTLDEQGKVIAKPSRAFTEYAASSAERSCG